MKKWSKKKDACALTIAWTFSTLLSYINFLRLETGFWALWGLISLLFTFNYMIQWIYYAKTQQEENNHE